MNAMNGAAGNGATGGDASMMSTGMSMVIADNNAFLMAMGEGSRVEIHAADAAKSSWTQLDGSVAAGAASITLADATGWEVGDRIAIASTGFEMDEAEQRTVVAVSDDGRTVTLDRALDNDHYGEIEQHSNGQTGADQRSWDVDMRAEVALLSRNVTIQGDEDSLDDGYGGHTMIMDGAAMHIDGAELTRMGQAGELGRYPLHWHMLGDASGQYVTNSSIHNTFNKGLTIHGTQSTWVENNAIVETVGHTYYFEDGSEFGNVLIGNLGMNTRQTDSVEAGPIGSDHTATSTYWVTNPDNHLIDNHAAGSDHVGFWILSQETVEGTSAGVALYDGYAPNEQLPGQWIGNASHTNGADGIFIGGQFIEETGERTPFDERLERTYVVEDFTTYKNQDFGLWARNADGEWSDIKIADTKKGARFWGSTELTDSVIVGRSENGETIGYDVYHGWELYDMASVLDGVHFAGFTGELDTAIANHSGFGRNTNNAITNVTFADDVAQRFATKVHNPYLDGAFDFGGGLMGGLHDVDGSLTGQPGAIITPGIIDSVPNDRADVLSYAFDGVAASGFNATAGAQYVADGNYWINAPSSVIGKVTFQTSGNENERVDFTITRTDNGASILYDRTAQQGNGWGQLNVDASGAVEYVVTHPDGPPPTPLGMQIRDLPRGASAVYRFTDLPQDLVIQGADQVGSRGALDAATGSAWYRDNNGDLVLRLVADTYQSRVYAATDDLPGVEDDVYQDRVDLIFEPEPGQVNTVNYRPSEDAPADMRPDPVLSPLPERAASTSDTVAVTDGLARWSDGTTWEGTVPGADDVVVIGPGEQVVLDTSIEVAGIIVQGEGAALIVEDDPSKTIDLVSDWVLIDDGGLFQAGTESDALDTEFTLTLTGDDPDFDLDVSAYVGGGVANTVFAATPAPEPDTVIGEAGSVTVGQRDAEQWHTVTFEQTISNAVVVMGPVGMVGGQPAMTRVRNVTDEGFEFQIDEWDYLDGKHLVETIGWMALSEGTHTLADGRTVVAGSGSVGTQFTEQGFGTELVDAVVFAEVSSVADPAAVTTRIRDVDATGFAVQLQEEEGADGVHDTESVDWIAIESGVGAGSSVFRTEDALTQRPTELAIDGFNASSVLLADMQTRNGGNTAVLRYDDLAPGSVEVFVQEEQSLDPEMAHLTEVGGVAALDDGLILGA